jgi:hypothetical protein
VPHLRSEAACLLGYTTPWADANILPKLERLPLSSSMTAVVNICTTLRQDSLYALTFYRQISNLYGSNFSIGTISIVHDAPSPPVSDAFKEFISADPRVNLVQEISSDSEITTLSEKARQWAQLGNQAIEAALETDCSHILYLEADLCVPLDFLEQLIARDVDIVAPVTMLGSTFYDTWGFRDMNGQKISDIQQFPFYSGELVELSSVGSCVLFRSEVFRTGIRLPGVHQNGLLVGVCTQARAAGFRVYADPTVSIIHPTSLWHSQTWKVVNITITRTNGASYPLTANLRVTGFYASFVVPELSRLGKDLAKMAGGPGAFILTIIRHTSTRTLTLLLEETGEYPPVPDSIGLDPSEQVRLSETI